MVGLFLAGALGLVGAWWSYPLLDLRKEHLPAVRLYAGSAEVAALQGTARHSQIWIPLGEIPQPVVDAVLVAEDRRFFHHPGIDVRAVLRAAVTNLLAEKLGEEQGQAVVLSNIGDLRRAQGRYADALSFHERAFEIADRLGTPERESYRRLRDQMRSQSRSPS